MPRLMLALGVVAALGTASARAGAQASNLAETKFQEGRAQLAAGKYAQACQNFAESQRAEPASGTLLALAYCQELSGLVASAWSNYRAAAELAEKEGQAERHAAASERGQAVAQRLSYLTIIVPPALASLDGFRITLDGVDVPKQEYDVPKPVDGGTHRIEASVHGQADWTAKIEIGSERDTKTLTVEVIAPRPAPGAVPPPPASSPASTRGGAPPTRGPGVATLALAAASAVGLGLGVGFSVVASSKNHASSRDGHCDANGCDATGTELRNEALTAADVATWSFVAAGLCATGAAVVHLTTRPSATQRSTQVKLTATPTLVRFELGTKF